MATSPIQLKVIALMCSFCRCGPRSCSAEVALTITQVLCYFLPGRCGSSKASETEITVVPGWLPVQTAAVSRSGKKKM